MASYEDATLIGNLDVNLQEGFKYYVGYNGTIWRMSIDCWPDCADVEKVSEIVISKTPVSYTHLTLPTTRCVEV